MSLFIDESGNTGTRFQSGSSAYFILAAVAFENATDVADADAGIAELKINAGYGKGFEFTYKRSTDAQLKQLLTLFQRRIRCHLIIVAVDKRSYAIKNKKQLYTDLLTDIIRLCPFDVHRIVMDEAFSDSGMAQVRRQIVGKLGVNIKMEQVDSKRDNLVQLADAVAGITSAWIKGSKRGTADFEYLRAKKKKIYIQ